MLGKIAQVGTIASRSSSLGLKQTRSIVSLRRSIRFFSSEEKAPAATDELAQSLEALKKDEEALTPKVQAVLDQICDLNMLEVAELASAIQEKFNLPEIGAGVALGGGAGGAGAEEPKEEKTAFDVTLKSFDAKSKIKVIKEIRGITGLGLKEAKALVEGVPSVLKKEIKKEEAEELIEKLKGVGAVAEMA